MEIFQSAEYPFVFLLLAVFVWQSFGIVNKFIDSNLIGKEEIRNIIKSINEEIELLREQNSLIKEQNNLLKYQCENLINLLGEKRDTKYDSGVWRQDKG